MSNSTAVLDAATQALITRARDDLRTTQIIFGAGYALVIYDWMICFFREMRLVWPQRWSFMKLLYLWCRYWPICTIPYVLYAYTMNHTLATCQHIFRIPVALATFNQLAAEVVLMLRTTAFLGNKNRILYSLATILTALLAFQLWVVFGPMELVPFVPGDTAGPCLPTSNGPQIMCFFLVSLAFDALVTTMMLWKVYTMRSTEHTSLTRNPLAQLFISEGLWYFIAAAIANIVNAVFFIQPDKTLSGALVPFSNMLPCILACRLILDLREHGQSSNVMSWVTTGRDGPVGLLWPKLWRKGDKHAASANNNNNNAGDKSRNPMSSIRFQNPNATPGTMNSDSFGTGSESKSFPVGGEALVVEGGEEVDIEMQVKSVPVDELVGGGAETRTQGAGTVTFEIPVFRGTTVSVPDHGVAGRISRSSDVSGVGGGTIGARVKRSLSMWR